MKQFGKCGQPTWALDRKGEAIHPSSGWTHLTGQPREEALGWGWLDRVNVEDARRVEEAIREAATSWSPWFVLFRVRRKDRRWIWFFNRASPTFDPHTGEFLGFFGTTTLENRPDDCRALSFVGDACLPVVADHLAFARALASRIGDRELVCLIERALTRASGVRPDCRHTLQ